MANEIPDSRNLVTTFETRFRAAISESTWTRIGAGINHIMNRQYDTLTFNLNGVYNKASGQTGLEGLAVFQFDMEIIGFSVGNLVTGSSGTTIFDVHLIDSGGTDQGTIFGTKPTITTAAGANAYASENFSDATSQTATGITLPTIPTKTYDQFDAFRIDVDSTMVDAENAFISFHYRPR